MTITGNSSNSGLLLGLFGAPTGGVDMTTLAVTAKNPLDSAAVTAATQAPVPPPPWNHQETPQQAGANVQNALAGDNVIGNSPTFSSAKISTGNPETDAKTMAYNQD